MIITRYLLNSAVITGPGRYTYRLVPAEEAATWLQKGSWVSRIGYPATADHIKELCGVRPELSRAATNMQPGDTALVVRLKYRMGDPGQKADHAPSEKDWEYGILTKEE